MFITRLWRQGYRRCAFLAMICLLVSSPVGKADDSLLPATVISLLKKNKISKAQVGIVARYLDGNQEYIINHNTDLYFNPASVTKIITMLAAIDLLGPTHQWDTIISTNGKQQGDTLTGDLYLIGGGNPTLNQESWLFLLSRLRHQGIRNIEGDIIIDDTVFTLPNYDPNAFDGAGLKPYNVGASGLLINFKVVEIVLHPTQSGVTVYSQTPNDNLIIENNLKISNKRCRNWRGKIKERLIDNGTQATLKLSGRYSRRCGEQRFYLSVLKPDAYASGSFSGVWQQLGGQWQGQSKQGKKPDNATPIIIHKSKPLSSILIDMNKYSNNVIARHLFLSLAPFNSDNTLLKARQILQQWLHEKGIEGTFIDNGSGLSRHTKITPRQMSLLLEYIWGHPYRSEMITSLPILGVDGTLRKRLKNSAITGQGHFKTGSLVNVKTISGFLRSQDGRYLSVVLFINGRGGTFAKRLQDDLMMFLHRHQ